MGVFTTTKTYRMGLNLMSQWWLSGASIDLDFDQQRYYDSSLAAGVQSLAPLSSYLSISRASTGYAKNSAGTWTSFGNDTLRITDLGLLIEDTRTNYLLNSDTPVTQTTGSLSTGSYTLWVEGSGSATASAGTATITGAAAATDGSPNIFTVTGAGTVTVTVSGSLTRFQLEAGAFASSFILSGGATATRATDNVTIIGSAATLMGGSAGTHLTQTRAIQPDATGQYIISRAAANRLQTRTANDSLAYLYNGAGVQINTASFSPKDVFIDTIKCAIAWDATGTRIAAEGSLGDTSGTAITDSGTPQLGTENTSGVYIGQCRYLRLTLWNTRLSDGSLQTVTTP